MLVYLRVFYSGTLFGWLSRLTALGRLSPRGTWRVPWWVWGPAATLAALLWIAVLSSPDGRLRVAFVDVG